MAESKRKIPIENFAYEIRQDLPELIAKYPDGILIQHFHDWYGEHPTRILKALTLLERKHALTVHSTASGTHYAVPVGYTLPTKFPELTDLQRRTLQLLLRTALNAVPPTNKVNSNYSQLARLLSCSIGGLQTVLQRLQHYGHISILSTAQQGKQSGLLIEIHQNTLTDHVAGGKK